MAGGIGRGRELAAPAYERQSRDPSSVGTTSTERSSGSSVQMLRRVSEESDRSPGDVARPEGVRVVDVDAAETRLRGEEVAQKGVRPRCHACHVACRDDARSHVTGRPLGVARPSRRVEPRTKYCMSGHGARDLV